MPELDGPAFYREVERQHGASRPHFIFLTGDVLNRATLDFLERTTVPTVSKPFAPEKCRQVVQQVLRSSLSTK